MFCLLLGIQCTLVADVGLATSDSVPSSILVNREDPLVSLQKRLPESIRKRLLANAGKNYEWEEMSIVPLRGQHDDLLSLEQRAMWTQNFNNARESGMSVAEAQEVALRGAADGRLYAQPRSEEELDKIGATTMSRRGVQSVTCMACHYAMPERAHVPVHYSSDWHLLNIQRKFLGMRPVSETEFPRRVAEAEAEEDLQISRAYVHSVKYKGSVGITADYLRLRDSQKRRSGQVKLRQQVKQAAAYEGDRDLLLGDIDDLSPKDRKRLEEEKHRNAVVPCEEVPVCMYVCMYLCMYVYIYICMYVRVYVC
jgi:hypothetical protein